MSKVSWFGTVISIQPRFRLLRTYSNRQHNYPGYLLKIDGQVDGKDKVLTVAIGKGAQEKNQFRAGDEASGDAALVEDHTMEIADYYKASKLKILLRESEDSEISLKSPYTGPAPKIEVYRSRGHRRLDFETYQEKCTTCVWGALMPTQVTPDNWNPKEHQFRQETFCYGPKSCSFYRAGEPRKVVNTAGDEWVEPDSVDEEETQHRGLYD